MASSGAQNSSSLPTQYPLVFLLIGSDFKLLCVHHGKDYCGRRCFRCRNATEVAFWELRWPKPEMQHILCFELWTTGVRYSDCYVVLSSRACKAYAATCKCTCTCMSSHAKTAVSLASRSAQRFLLLCAVHEVLLLDVLD